MAPEHPPEPKERQNLRREILSIRKAIRSMENDHPFDVDTLQNHNIRVLPLGLGGDGSLRPKIFTPYSRENFIEPTDKVVGGDTSKKGFGHLGSERLSMSKLSGGGYVLIDTR